MSKVKNITPVYDLVLNQGEDTRIQLHLSEEEDGKRTEINIEGFTFTCKVREEAGDESQILTASFTILDQRHGLVELYFKAEDTTALILEGAYYGSMTKYTYDIFMKDINGDEQRILCGHCYISPSVSNR